MAFDVIDLTRELVKIPSVSDMSNVPISDFLQDRMAAAGFVVERLSYQDANGETKVSLVGRLGQGEGGLAFFSHSDTVPGQEGDWDAFEPRLADGRLYGRGSCDMKGPLAATLAAAVAFDPNRLAQPIFVVVTADEEVGGYGARQVVAESKLLRQAETKWGVVAEPTRLVPIYAHKGVAGVTVTAHGEAAHSSTDAGVSANFLIAPFLAEMAELARVFKEEERFMNHEFRPPTNGFNMVLNDGNCPANVTAARTTCTLSFRAMPDAGVTEIVDMIVARAEQRGFEVSTYYLEPLYTPPDAPLVQAACRATGAEQAETVPYGTDGFFLQELMRLVVLGPGDIGLAHTVGEYILVAELKRAVDVYQRLIAEFCV